MLGFGLVFCTGYNRNSNEHDNDCKLFLSCDLSELLVSPRLGEDFSNIELVYFS